MSILQIFNWLLCGLSTCIAFVLWVVIVIYLGLGDEPSIQDDWGSLLTSTGLFSVMAAISGAAVWSMQKRKPWRWVAEAGVALCLFGMWALMESLR